MVSNADIGFVAWGGRYMARSRRRLKAFILSAPLLLAACGGQAGSQPAASSTPSASGAMTAKFLSPSSGTVVTGNAIDLKVQVSGYRLSCAQAGKPNKEGVGHYHIELDHALVNMYCTESTRISMQNVAPGSHTLTLLPTKNDHEEVKSGAEDMTFTYTPTSPMPAITAATLASPSIKILSPAPGSKVSGAFTVKVAINNFNSSCDLFGKANLAGYGHWHLNVNSMTGPMMGMATMLGMSCGSSFDASTEGLTSGHHKFFALLVDNQHAPLMPDIADQVDLIVQ